MSIALHFNPGASPADTIRRIGLATLAVLPVIALCLTLAAGFRGASDVPTAEFDYANWVTW